MLYFTIVHWAALPTFQTQLVPGKFNHRHLHTQANAEKGLAMRSRPVDGRYLPFRAAIAKPARYQNAAESKADKNRLATRAKTTGGTYSAQHSIFQAS